MPKLTTNLINLASDIIQAGSKETKLETDNHSWADAVSLRVYWFQGRFECTLTLTEYGKTLTGPTWYDPPETEVRETTETASFVKIRDMAGWAKNHGVNLEF